MGAMRLSSRWTVTAVAVAGLGIGLSAPTSAQTMPVASIATTDQVNIDADAWDDSAAPSPSDVAQHLAEQARQANQSIVQRDYSDWEAAQAAKAADALEQRLTLAAVADQAQQEAAEAYNDAQEHASSANGEASVKLAATAHARAVANHERALVLAAHAREQAQAEAKTLAALRQSAIASQVDARAAATTPKIDQAVAAQPQKKYAWSTFVANVDSQEAIDACEGGLTYSPEISDILGKPYYPIHNFCNGTPILDLHMGDLVHIDDVGDFRVVGAQDVNKGDTTSAILDLPGDAVLQTCYEIGNKMRVVGIEWV